MGIIGKELEAALGVAVSEARSRGHEYLCPEHVLFALLDDAYGKAILTNCGADMGRLREDIDAFFVDETTGWAVGSSGKIIRTTDGATSWNAQTSGTTEILRGVQFPPYAAAGSGSAKPKIVSWREVAPN